jgi:hypothetical protein
VETLAFARYRSPDAAMQPAERKMAVDGLTNSVRVLPAEVVSQISSLSAPVMACFGFALYFIRLGELEQRYRANKRDQHVSAQTDDILAGMPPYTAPAGEPDANGFVVPPKDLIRGLQENG